LILELQGHFAAKGLYADFLAHLPYTIGFFEAHGLAFLIGLLFLSMTIPRPHKHWHLFAVGVHALLGIANLLFWGSFIYFGLTTPGLIATLLHVGFIILQGYCFLRH